MVRATRAEELGFEVCVLFPTPGMTCTQGPYIKGLSV